MKYQEQGIKIKSVSKLPLQNINKVIADNFSESPTLVSIDVEGLDEMILHELDFQKYQPLFICVETVIFNINKEYIKRQGILDFMTSKGYFIYADTHINTIFCSREHYNAFIKHASFVNN